MEFGGTRQVFPNQLGDMTANIFDSHLNVFVQTFSVIFELIGFLAAFGQFVQNWSYCV